MQKSLAHEALRTKSENAGLQLFLGWRRSAQARTVAGEVQNLARLVILALQQAQTPRVAANRIQGQHATQHGWQNGHHQKPNQPLRNIVQKNSTLVIGTITET